MIPAFAFLGDDGKKDLKETQLFPKLVRQLSAGVPDA